MSVHVGTDLDLSTFIRFQFRKNKLVSLSCVQYILRLFLYILYITLIVQCLRLICMLLYLGSQQFVSQCIFQYLLNIYWQHFFDNFFVISLRILVTVACGVQFRKHYFLPENITIDAQNMVRSIIAGCHLYLCTFDQVPNKKNLYGSHSQKCLLVLKM